MVSRDIVGWGLNLGLQQAPKGQCRLLAGALPGKCSIDVGELVALLKFMQEAINTFVNKPSEEQIGVLVYTIDSMGQGDVVEEAWRVGDVDAIVKLCGNPALVTEITKARCMLQGMGYLVLVVRVSAHMGDYANYIADAGAKAGSRMEKVVEPKLGRRYVDANGDKQGSTPSWEELPGDVGTRGVWQISRVSPGAPANLACEGRVACLNGLVRGACQPRFVEAALRTHTHPAAFVAGARHVPVGRTVLAECVPLRRDALRDSAGGTRLERRLPRRHGWHPWRGARLRKDQDRSTGKLFFWMRVLRWLFATFSPCRFWAYYLHSPYALRNARLESGPARGHTSCNSPALNQRAPCSRCCWSNPQRQHHRGGRHCGAGGVDQSHHWHYQGVQGGG